MLELCKFVSILLEKRMTRKGLFLTVLITLIAVTALSNSTLAYGSGSLPAGLYAGAETRASVKEFFLAGCFDSDPGIRNHDRAAHAAFAARTVDPARIGENLSTKVGILFGCKDAETADLVEAFAEISVKIADHSTQACFPNDRGAMSTDAALHKNWAKNQTREQLRSNIMQKVSTAARCLRGNALYNYFADVSVSIADVPVDDYGTEQPQQPKQPPTPPSGTINIQGKRFIPEQLTVKDGETFTICNRDPFFHSPFSYSKHNMFGDPKGIRLSPGGCTTITAKNPTAENIPFAIFDELHANEKLSITVLPGKKDPVVTPGPGSCNAAEYALWNRIVGKWEASYGAVTFEGTCDNVYGFWKQGAYGDKGDKHTGKISLGRVRGDIVTYKFDQDWNSKTGTDSCRLSPDGRTLTCTYLETLRR